MTDAEMTIKHMILSGYIDLKSKSPDEIQNTIFNKIFDPTTIWAIEEYLQELKK